MVRACAGESKRREGREFDPAGGGSLCALAHASAFTRGRVDAEVEQNCAYRRSEREASIWEHLLRVQLLLGTKTGPATMTRNPEATPAAHFDEAPAAAAIELDGVAATPPSLPTSRTLDKVEAKITRPGDSNDESPLSCLDFTADDSSGSSRYGRAASKASIGAGDAADGDASLHDVSLIIFEERLSQMEAAAAPNELKPPTDARSTLTAESPRRGEAAVPKCAGPTREGAQNAASDGDEFMAADGDTIRVASAANALAAIDVWTEEGSAEGGTQEAGENAQRETAELEVTDVVTEAGIVFRSEDDETGGGQGPYLFTDLIFPDDAMESIMGQLPWYDLIGLVFVNKAWKTMALRCIKVLDLRDIGNLSVLSLSKALHTMPGLEELHLPEFLQEDSPRDLNAGSKLLRALGRHCPKLKALGAVPTNPFSNVPFSFSSAALEALLVGCPLMEDLAIGSMDPYGVKDQFNILPGPALWPREGVEVKEEGPDQECLEEDEEEGAEETVEECREEEEEGSTEEEEEEHGAEEKGEGECRDEDEGEGGAEEEEEGECREGDEEEGGAEEEVKVESREEDEEEGADEEEERHHTRVVRDEGEEGNDGKGAAWNEQGTEGRARSVEENAALAALTLDVAAAETPLDALPLRSARMHSDEGNDARGISGVTSLAPASDMEGEHFVDGLGCSALKQVENAQSSGNPGESLAPGASFPVPGSEGALKGTQPGASSPASANEAVLGSRESTHSRAILKSLGLVHSFLPAPAGIEPSQLASLEHLSFTGCLFLSYKGGPVTGTFEIAAKATNLTSLVINHQLSYVYQVEAFPTEEVLDAGRRRMELLTPLKMLRSLSLIRIHVLDSIAVSVASELTSLRSLHLECLYDMHDIASVGEFTQLTHLSISIIHFVEMPQQLSQLVDLEHFRVTKCDWVEEVPAWIGTFTKLTELDLTEMVNIRRLPRSVGQLANLQILRLSLCPIRWLPRELGQLSQLRLLDLTHAKGTTRLQRWLPNLEIHQEELPDETEGWTAESGEESSDEDTGQDEEEEVEEGSEWEEEDEEGGEWEEEEEEEEEVEEEKDGGGREEAEEEEEVQQE